MAANRRLAEIAGLTAPRPPPDTERGVIERYVVRKYRGNAMVDSHKCREASRLLERELAEEVERRRLEKEKAEREAREAHERAQREQLERERRAAAEREQQSRAALHPGGFKDASPHVGVSRSLPSGNGNYRDSGNAGQNLSGLVVVDIIAVNLFKERVQDLRYMGAWFLNLTVSLSLGKITTLATSERKSSASVRWEPPEQREIRWDCRERWLWCRVDDHLLGGSSQIAGVGLIDVRAAEAEAADASGLKVAEMELELLAKEPNMNPSKNRDANAACWQLAVGHHGPPGPPGGHGHYMFEQVEDLDHITHGETCGTIILRIQVHDPLGGVAPVASHPVVAPPRTSATYAPSPPDDVMLGAQMPIGMPPPASSSLPGHALPAQSTRSANYSHGYRPS